MMPRDDSLSLFSSVSPEPSAVVARIKPLKRDTKSKGDVSELRVAVALAEAGYVISKPLGENQRYDLIADDGRQLHRVQVKTGRIRNGVVLFNCSSTHGHRNTRLSTRSYAGQIEMLAVYCPDNQKVYALREEDLRKAKIQLRLIEPCKRGGKPIRWASRYELA